jgi:hypothetical protein
MLRFMIVIFAAMAAIEPAASADRAVTHHGWHRSAVMLPARLPRPHYRFRTTISYRAAQSGPRLSVYENPRLLYAPDYAEVAYIPRAIPYVPYWDRLPYACSVYGYC